MKKSLAEIKVGARGTILGFTQERSCSRQKLLAMGLIKGTEFQVARVAPLGDPVEIRVRGFALSLRRDEARTLLVQEVMP